jgi:hypothetical protein
MEYSPGQTEGNQENPVKIIGRPSQIPTLYLPYTTIIDLAEQQPAPYKIMGITNQLSQL